MSSGRIISILQPVYLPWLGFFEQMAVADLFVFMDDVQYTARDWRNRNRIKTAAGSIWLTVPVKKHPRSARILDIDINYAEDWRKRHLRSIEINYGKSPYFRRLFSDLERELLHAPAKLVDLNCRLIRLLCRFLEIDTKTARSSEVPRSPESQNDKNQRIIDICRHFRADLLYDGAKAAEFIDLSRFRRAGIEVVFQDYRHPVYRQNHGRFLASQSAIDLIANTGPAAAAILRSSPLPKRLLDRIDWASVPQATVARAGDGTT